MIRNEAELYESYTYENNLADILELAKADEEESGITARKIYDSFLAELLAFKREQLAKQHDKALRQEMDHDYWELVYPGMGIPKDKQVMVATREDKLGEWTCHCVQWDEKKEAWKTEQGKVIELKYKLSAWRPIPSLEKVVDLTPLTDVVEA